MPAQTLPVETRAKHCAGRARFHMGPLPARPAQTLNSGSFYGVGKTTPVNNDAAKPLFDIAKGDTRPCYQQYPHWLWRRYPPDISAVKLYVREIGEKVAFTAASSSLTPIKTVMWFRQAKQSGPGRCR
ncbi:hypothetical protein KCP76_23410 [Salmonella enterica subsp. enterica serovar Weltevreden]|nr:hypothetical protein KCP76_23410 [Salmonella enterica subsp. enterica serovar Weltevreden]